jgi:hypothetical protein
MRKANISALINESLYIVFVGANGMAAFLLAHMSDEFPNKRYVVADNFNYGFTMAGTEVIDGKAINELLPIRESVFIICSRSKSTHEQMECQLRQLGAKKIISWIDVYCAYVLPKRSCVDKLALTSVCERFLSASTAYSLAVILNTTCTLRCRHCSLRIPYIQPYIGDANAICSDVTTIVNASGGLVELLLQGGEPFLYKDLAMLLERLSALPIIQLFIITNATMRFMQWHFNRSACRHSNFVGRHIYEI